jgi:BASS family bile acid:Na+ symporter
MSSTALVVLKDIAFVAVAGVAFAVGLEAARPPSRKDLGAIARGLLATLVGVPLIAVFIVATMGLPDPVRAGLLIIAISIGPVAALKISARKGGARSDAVVLNLTLMCLSLVYVPLAAYVLSHAFGRDIVVPVASVAKVMLPRQLIPLALGLAVAWFAPELKARIARPVSIAANVIFGLLALAVIVVLLKPMLALGGHALWGVVVLAIGAAALGRALGGRDPAMRGMLAAFSTLRFPALALSLAQLTAEPKRVLPVVGAYVVASLLALPVAAWADHFVSGGKGRTVSRQPSSARV